MKRVSLRRGAAAAGVAWLGLGCGLGGVPRAELPEDPIAISYRTPEEARRRADDYQDGRQPGEARRTTARPPRAGYADLVASEENVSEFLDRLFGRGPEDERRHQGRLALLNPRTGQVEVLAAARRGSVPVVWSPDRQRLLFAQPDGDGFQIFEYDRGERTVRQVTHGPLSHTQGCYGPDGRIVVAVVDARSSPLRTYIAISGTGGRRPFRPLTDGPSDHSPACQPGLDRLVFVREIEPPRAEIFVTDLDPDAGEPPRRLSPGRHPSFTSDGVWVAFAAPFQKESRLWRMRADGTGRSPIGRGVRHESRPAVSPDGTLVVYVAAETQPRRHLYVRRFDGSGDRILFADGDAEFPVW
ncbi:MAG: TolB family protein [Myxococcota bacterium]